MGGSAGADEPSGPGAARDAIGILFVCTANQCRSVVAEALARRRFGDQPFVVGSAGLLLEEGRPTPPTGVAVAAEYGIDLSRHRSRRIDTRRLGDWDLVLVMSRRHLRELVAADPALWPRVFTVPQFVRWLGTHPLGRHAAPRSWIDVLAEERPRSEMIGSRPEDEVPDPVDGPAEQWRELFATLTTAIDAIAAGLAPGASVPTRSDPHPARHAIGEVAAVEELGALSADRRIHRERSLDGAP